ncbi:fumarylacetoacetate hydrolase family protein [Propioniciclava soli]|uniref:fumarylacetoacetate hydrolase family protein n=1 Tax=Propioniciclava soli TaxID=2775081 RepID=UPI001E51EA97|nr:fumarylacetoacetate hydrolase family protein [Propioniciclava soli]
MKLATIRTPDGTRAVRVDADHLIDLGAADLGDFLARDDWADAAAAASAVIGSASDAEYATLIGHPSKVVCVGLNYATHITEMGRPLPEHPTLFPKFADTLIGAHDPIVRPEETQEFDWEAELVVVIGKPVRRASGAEAEAAIAGFTVMNDITCRDWQFRTREWTQGKNFDSTTPVGPVLVTPDEVGGVRPALAISTEVDGQTMQSDTTGDLVFDPVALVEYVSTMIRLNPGDLIASGTPGGVGHARKPPVYLAAGQTVTCTIEGIGSVSNEVVAG